MNTIAEFASYVGESGLMALAFIIAGAIGRAVYDLGRHKLW